MRKKLVRPTNIPVIGILLLGLNTWQVEFESLLPPLVATNMVKTHDGW